MANPIGDPDDVQRLAELYRREAERVAEVSSSSLQALVDIEWKGRRATETRARVRTRHNDITAQVDELRSLARMLESHAAWMRATIRELKDLEHRIRSWADANPPSPERVGPDASLIGAYPSHCSLAWRHLARQLRAAGAVF